MHPCRFVTLQAEATRLADNASLSPDQRAALLRGRYASLMSPVLLVLERNLRSNAAAEPETPAEQRFLKAVLPRLRAAVSALRRAQGDAGGTAAAGRRGGAAAGSRGSMSLAEMQVGAGWGC